jgi:membrane-associated phospholipid phosphatase
MNLSPAAALSQPLRVLLVGVSVIALSHLLDPLGWRYLNVDGVYSDDLGRMLRVMGYVPVWLALAAAFILHDRPLGRACWRRGGTLVAGILAAGVTGEVLKVLLRRERPWAHEGEYVFRSFSERPFSSSGLAWPSSHAIIAFGAAAILSRLFPRARIVFWGLAWGCALSRVADGAHFVSDVVTSAVVAWVIGDRVWHLTSHRALLRGTDVAPSA